MSHRHRCAFCGNRYWRFGSLMRHILRAHHLEVPKRLRPDPEDT